VRGHIARRGDSWTAIVDLPADPTTGKRRQKRVTARTKKEVELEVAKLIGKAQTGFTDAGKVTVGEFLDNWLASVGPSLRPSTVRRYRDVVRLHITSQIGSLRLSRLTPSDVQCLYANRLEGGLSSTSLHHVHAILHRALDQGVKWGLLARNVTDAVDPPRRQSPAMQVWSATDAARVLATANGDALEALWHLALTTGMRRGELLGLRWSDIDLNAGTLSVRRTLSRGSTSRLENGEPKTVAGRRRVALPASSVERLRRRAIKQKELWLAVGPGYGDRDLVFATVNGTHIHPNTLSRAYRKLIERAGVPRIRFHDLRHTSATLLLANGEHPKVVQERLGHASISETLDRYSHVSADMQQRAAARFDDIFDEAKEDEVTGTK
jgi:integrase